MGGFECSTHRRPSGRRVDVIDATRHDHFAAADYTRLSAAGLLTARDGLRWPLIERLPGTYDFSSAALQVSGSRAAGVEVIWDLLHYGLPDHVDVFAADFPHRFAAFAQACASYLMVGHTGPLWLCPINEISFFAWGGGEVAYLPPFARGQGDPLKRALVRAVIAGIDAVRTVAPDARFIHAEPLIEVSVHPERLHEVHDAHMVQGSQFEALDMLAGRVSPELGGHPRYLDVIGVNYYPYNQWHHHPDHQQRTVLPPTSLLYRPLRDLLAEVATRYGRPLLIAETGSEDETRAAWFAMVTREALAARTAGVPVQGVCLYPVVNHPGWDDDRHCHNGLWDYPDAAGNREVHEPLAHALSDALVREAGTREERVPADLAALDRWTGSLSRAAEMVAAEVSRMVRRVRSQRQLP
ncbi:beta-glucosidase [Deinococcus altitudinis]|uniref:beta-glucosidase n=1 Tax=Deinococcus altitudinis TaxID=468914 RepID=UPI003891E89A